MSSHQLVIKDALWQLFWRLLSALFGFVITKIIASYLGPLRYGDYGTIFRFFAWWTALVDFGIYVIAVKQLGQIKNATYGEEKNIPKPNLNSELAMTYGKFVGTRTFLIALIYTLAIVVAYLIPAYTTNPFIMRGLPFAMCYSASNMFAGIQQLPLQIFRKMKRLTWSLIIARFSQLFVLIPVVYLFFTQVDFEYTTVPDPVVIVAFVLVIFSVVASSIGQNIEMHLRTKDLLPLKISFDFSFIKNLLSKNRKYGFSYFFSSFHTLLVLMFLGWFFPTAHGFKYAWIWALALSLIEILLIIPSSLGNSLLHKIPNYSNENKKKSLGNLLLLVTWIGIIIAINFWIFAEDIIIFVSSRSFVWTWESVINRGSNQILPFLWMVLVLSFIKQVYNYLFVALEKQNILFGINLTGVLIGAGVGLFLIPQWGVVWGVITQLLIELLFTFWAVLLAKKKGLKPIIQKKIWFQLLGIFLVFIGIGLGIWCYLTNTTRGLNLVLGGWELPAHWRELIRFFLLAIGFNGLLLFASFYPMKRLAKGLTND